MMALFLVPSQKLTIHGSPVKHVTVGSHHACKLGPTCVRDVLRRCRKFRSSAGQARPGPSHRALIRRSKCYVGTKAALTLPQLLPATTVQGVWTGLIIAAAAGLWSERTRYLLQKSTLVCMSVDIVSTFKLLCWPSSGSAAHAGLGRS